MTEVTQTNPWKTLKSELKFDTPWIAVTKHDIINPAGNEGIYGTVSFKNLAIGVLPLDNEGNTWIVGQWRYPLKQYSWEIIEGGGPFGIDPIESAKRELKEEAGIIAKNYMLLCNMHTSNSVTDEYCHIYLARDLEITEAEPEETEDLVIKKIPFSKAYEMVMNGEITDSLSMVAILKTKILIDENQI